MNCLFKTSLKNKLPIELIYINNQGVISQRAVIMRKITPDSILTYDMKKQQLRSFKQANILSAAKQRRRLNHG